MWLLSIIIINLQNEIKKQKLKSNLLFWNTTFNFFENFFNVILKTICNLIITTSLHVDIFLTWATRDSCHSMVSIYMGICLVLIRIKFDFIYESSKSRRHLLFCFRGELLNCCRNLALKFWNFSIFIKVFKLY